MTSAMTKRGPSALRCVVFDLDGTLIDSEPVFHEAATRLLALRGKRLRPEIQQAMMGTPARNALVLFRDAHELTESLDELRDEAARHFFEVLGTALPALLPGALEILDRLEAFNVPMAIGTSSGAAYVARVMGPLGLLERFDFVLTCDDVVHGKPHPEMYLKAAATFGVPPAAMLVVEDSPNGVRAAKGAGAFCVCVPHGLVPLEQVSTADAIVPSLTDPALLRLLGLCE